MNHVISHGWKMIRLTKEKKSSLCINMNSLLCQVIQNTRWGRNKFKSNICMDLCVSAKLGRGSVEILDFNNGLKPGKHMLFQWKKAHLWGWEHTFQCAQSWKNKQHYFNKSLFCGTLQAFNLKGLQDVLFALKQGQNINNYK